MNIPKTDILKNSKNIKEMEILIEKAEKAYKTWEPIWSDFVSAPLREEVINKFKSINDVECFSFGGYKSAERQRICFTRIGANYSSTHYLDHVKGIHIEGNFLFDRANQIDFRNALQNLGASNDEIGDIWTIRDRGGQVLCTPELSREVNAKYGKIRDIEIIFKKREIDQLNLPAYKTAKLIKTVEASKRLDAIASAGFGMSRAKISSAIKEGRIRLNWCTINQGSRQLSEGDRLQLENKGSLEILLIEMTKKQRWKVELLRQ